MYFDDCKNFPDATLNPKLLWEFNLINFDFKGMRNIVVQRVIERGWPNDWYFILNKYGIGEIKLAIKELAYLNDKDMSFVSHQFNIPLTSMKCYEKKQSLNLHWDS
ncbi:hypothetical protein AAKU52_001880 [Pedobacter sp. CG_S7]|uniref:DUF6922 domain-containing protein n=1 Tax=Pedobacter sp. CG_S7 TaxID=3143930 RepID=UPI00339AFB90